MSRYTWECKTKEESDCEVRPKIPKCQIVPPPSSLSHLPQTALSLLLWPCQSSSLSSQWTSPSVYLLPTWRQSINPHNWWYTTTTDLYNPQSVSPSEFTNIFWQIYSKYKEIVKATLYRYKYICAVWRPPQFESNTTVINTKYKVSVTIWQM